MLKPIKVYAPKHSIRRKITFSIVSVVALFLIQFIGVFISRQNILSGLSNLHRQQQLSDSVLRLHQLNDVLAEIPGRSIGSRQELKKLFDSVFSQVEVKLSEVKDLARDSSEYLPYLNQMDEGLKGLNSSAQRRFSAKSSIDLENELSLVRQYSSDILEGEEKLKLQVESSSNELFDRVYKMRYRPSGVAMALTLLFVTYALTAGIRFKRRLGASIGNLLSATQEIAKGNLDLRAPVGVRDEIGVLTEAFNEMTRELQHSTVSWNYVRAVMQSLPDALFVLSPSGIIERANRSACEMYGDELSAFEGKPLRTFLSPETPPLEKELRDVETVFNTPGGKSIVVSLSSSVIWDQSGRVLNVACVMKDLTERKAIDLERRRIGEIQVALADASSLLSSSIDFEVTLKSIVKATVPRIGDFCLVHLVDKNGSMNVAESSSNLGDKTVFFQKNPVVFRVFHSKKPR